MSEMKTQLSGLRKPLASTMEARQFKRASLSASARSGLGDGFELAKTKPPQLWVSTCSGWPSFFIFLVLALGSM